MSGRPLARTIRPNVPGPFDRGITDEGIVSKKDTSQKDAPPIAPLTPDISRPVSFPTQTARRATAFIGHPAAIPITIINTSDSIFMEYMSSRQNETLVHNPFFYPIVRFTDSRAQQYQRVWPFAIRRPTESWCSMEPVRRSTPSTPASSVPYLLPFVEFSSRTHAIRGRC